MLIKLQAGFESKSNNWRPAGYTGPAAGDADDVSTFVFLVGTKAGGAYSKM